LHGAHSSKLDPERKTVLIARAELAAALRAVSIAAEEARPFKDALDRDESAAAASEANARTAAGSTTKNLKVKASIARRKAIASAKSAAPWLKLVEEAEARREAAQQKVDALVVSVASRPPSFDPLTGSAPSIIPTTLADQDHDDLPRPHPKVIQILESMRTDSEDRRSD
jgi:hypothetical protein